MNSWHPFPPALYTLVEQKPGTVLLESSRPGSSSFSHIFTDPVSIIEARTPADLADLFFRIEDAVSRNQFAAGFFAYECGQYFEPTAALVSGHEGDLLAWFGIYERCYKFDHTTETFLDGTPPGEVRSAEPCASSAGTLSFAMNEEEYSAHILKIHEWIRAGDVYQLNYTFPIEFETGEQPAALYARLRAAQPVDYGAFLHCQTGQHIVSLSPELFFRVEQDGEVRRITTQPMKGTARRGRTTAEDGEIAARLTNDPKNRAENVMIVDLLRNDLGRICTFGSVRVEKLFEVERYPTLWQMTSTVSGELRLEIGCEAIFRALFPCGSITGAPKVRAMQLLAQLEAAPRGIYCGAIGYFSRQKMIFNVPIRTLLLVDGTATMGVGSGIVIDSDPPAEYRECRLKSEFLTRSVEPFSLIETMLWTSGFPLLDLHLDRLTDSANYFAYSCDRASIKARLLAEASRFPDQHPRKVRLLLDADGAIHIESSILAAQSANSDGPPSVCVAARRTDPADCFLFHKTTHRGLYDATLASAARAGFADALFFNTHGEVTEGAISNILIEKEGRWYTPPISCGVLPGVYRCYLLKTRPEIEEKSVTLDELTNADAVYICNALRGLRRVIVSFATVIE